MHHIFTSRIVDSSERTFIAVARNVDRIFARKSLKGVENTLMVVTQVSIRNHLSQVTHLRQEIAHVIKDVTEIDQFRQMQLLLSLS